jgi:hypothetical protein
MRATLFVLAALSASACRADGLAGWGNAQWGMTAEQVIAAFGSEKVRPEWRPLREDRYRGDGKKSAGPTQNVLGFYSLGIDSFDAPRTPGNVLEAAFAFSEE